MQPQEVQQRVTFADDHKHDAAPAQPAQGVQRGRSFRLAPLPGEVVARAQAANGVHPLARTRSEPRNFVRENRRAVKRAKPKNKLERTKSQKFNLQSPVSKDKTKAAAEVLFNWWARNGHSLPNDEQAENDIVREIRLLLKQTEEDKDLRNAARIAIEASIRGLATDARQLGNIGNNLKDLSRIFVRALKP